MWSDPAAWRLPEGGLPTGGELRIPLDRRIILDIDPPTVTKLIIEGELLCHVDQAAHRVLTVDVLLIRHTGKFECGTVDAPHVGSLKVDISYGDRVIGVQYDFARKTGGELKLFGAAKTPAWSRLYATAAAGATQITMQKPAGSASLGWCNWVVDDRIVIAPSSFDQNDAEEKTITAVALSAGGTYVTLTLNSALSHAHEVLTESYGADGASVDLRPEVAVLTRSIIIKGTPTSHQRTPIPQPSGPDPRRTSTSSLAPSPAPKAARAWLLEPGRAAEQARRPMLRPMAGPS